MDRELGKHGALEEIPTLKGEPLTQLPSPPPHLGCASWWTIASAAKTDKSHGEVIAKVCGVLRVSMEIASSLGIAFAFGTTKTCLMLFEQRSPVAGLAADSPGIG